MLTTLTFTTLVAFGRENGFTVRKLDSEYQIKPNGSSWDGDSVYFTTDIKDAYDTLRSRIQSREHSELECIRQMQDTFRRLEAIKAHPVMQCDAKRDITDALNALERAIVRISA